MSDDEIAEAEAQNNAGLSEAEGDENGLDWSADD